MTNKPDLKTLGIEVAIAVAEAPFNEMRFQSHRLAEMVGAGMIDAQGAVNVLFVAAIAADLRRVHGDAFVMDLIGVDFEVAA